MAGFTLAPHCLVDSATLSKFIYGIDDGTVGMTSQQIANVQLCVAAASKQILNFIDLDIKAASFVEVWDGADSDELVTKQWPINSITSIKLSSNGVFTNSTPLDSSGYYTDGNSIMFRDGFRVPRGRGLLQVIYNAGYTTVPEDLQLACLMQTQYLLQQTGKIPPMVGLESVRKMDESQTKDKNLSEHGLRAEVEAMCKEYQRFEAPLSIMFARVS